MNDKFNVGSISVKKGTKKFGTIPVTTMASGFEIQIPLHIIAGVNPGPTLTLVPMLHGHEFTVIGIVQEILKLINPKNLNGNIIAIRVMQIAINDLFGNRHL